MTATKQQSVAQREVGIVKFYDRERAYGFLIDHGGGDIFFHINDVAGGRELQKNERVEFTRELGKSGRYRATNILERG